MSGTSSSLQTKNNLEIIARKKRHHNLLYSKNLNMTSQSVTNVPDAPRLTSYFVGACPVCRWEYAAIAAVIRFVYTHFDSQISALDALTAHERVSRLSADLEQCRLDEVQHLDDAINALPAEGLIVQMWTRLSSRNSSIAVSLARHF
jgi:demethoxyubiquinone hydroxylase (CLK1/Coq7/Cat5 family)